MDIPIKTNDMQFYVKRRWCEIGIHTFIKILIISSLFLFVFYREIDNLAYLWIHDKNWSHGFLIPLFSLYFLNQRKKEIINLPAKPNYYGLPLLIASIGFYLFNIASPSGWAYFSSLSMIAAISAIAFFLGGWSLLRHSWLAIAFLIFALPVPDRFYRSMTIPMRQWAATAAAAVLNLVNGMQAIAKGAVIDVMYKGRQLEPSLDVAEACSGMRLLMAFLALGVVMAYIHHRPLWQRIILLASTIPIAIFCNIVRVTCTGFIYVFAGPEYTQGIYHDLLGIATLPLAFGLYGLLAWFMQGLFIEEGKTVNEDIIIRGSGLVNRGSALVNRDSVPVTHDSGLVSRIFERRAAGGERRFRPAFLICAMVLLAAGAGSQAAIDSLKKEPIQLRKSLDLLDEKGLSHYIAEPQNKLKITNPDILKALGTRDYIQWIVEDNNAPANSPVRKLSLFITYYPSPDKVPHVPEECYAGSGFQRISSTGVTLHINERHLNPDGFYRDGNGKPETGRSQAELEDFTHREISAQYLVFGDSSSETWLGSQSFPVLYFFRVNGEYAAGREEVRIVLNKNLYRKSSYFSKIELVFNQTAPAPDKDETIQAAQSLLSVILPLLEQEYWPQW